MPTTIATPSGRIGPESLRLLAPRPWAKTFALVLLLLLALTVAGLIFIPWQQSVTGVGRVMVYSAMERPQSIEAQIPGRLMRWDVQEGQDVRAGELIAEIKDIDSKFLDTAQPDRLARQREALVQRKLAAETRLAALTGQLEALGRSRSAALPTAGERAEQADQRLRAARETLVSSQQAYRAGKEAVTPAAQERARQAADRERAAAEALIAAEQSLKGSAEVGVPSAREKLAQARERLTAAEEAQVAAQQTLQIALEVTAPTARERFGQAGDRRKQADQTLTAARQTLQTAQVQRRRIQELFQKDLRSRRDDELAQLDLVRAQTEVERSEAALAAADRDVKVASLDLERAAADIVRTRTEVARARTAVDIARREVSISELDQTRAQVDLARARTEVERARAAVDIARRDTRVAGLDANRADFELVRTGTEVERSRAALDIARRDTRIGDLDQLKVDADTSATLSSIQASVASARETIASMTSDILKIEVELENARARVEQQRVRAPRDGKIVRLGKVGAGETVKAGDVLAVLAPTTADRAVEIYLTDNDAPLVAPGRPVRVQFAGWPAVQFTGWPSVAVGTFAGRVTVVDAIDDGSSRYRVIVQPDQERIRAGKDEPWPPAGSLRPGAEATGWVLLDRVSLGFELWRQFNAFPPTVQREPIGKKDAKGGGYPGGISYPAGAGKEKLPEQGELKLRGK